jgi:hypothetical protein
LTAKDHVKKETISEGLIWLCWLVGEVLVQINLLAWHREFLSIANPP